MEAGSDTVVTGNRVKSEHNVIVASTDRKTRSRQSRPATVAVTKRQRHPTRASLEETLINYAAQPHQSSR